MPNLKDRFRDGEILVGTWLNGPVASQVEIIGGAGFDFVILDSEHSSYGLDQCEDLVRAADASSSSGSCGGRGANSHGP